MPVAGRLGRNPQHLGDLAVGQLLEMAQRDHLAVDRLHLIERLLDLESHLGADQRLAGGGEPAQELGRQRGRAGLGQGAAMERDLAVGVPHRRAEVAAVDPLHPLADNQAEPEIDGQLGPAADVLRHLLGQVEIGFLEDVGGIHAAPGAGGRGGGGPSGGAACGSGRRARPAPPCRPPRPAAAARRSRRVDQTAWCPYQDYLRIGDDYTPRFRPHDPAAADTAHPAIAPSAQS